MANIPFNKLQEMQSSFEEYKTLCITVDAIDNAKEIKISGDGPSLTIRNPLHKDVIRVSLVGHIIKVKERLNKLGVDKDTLPTIEEIVADKANF